MAGRRKNDYENLSKKGDFKEETFGGKGATITFTLWKAHHRQPKGRSTSTPFFHLEGRGWGRSPGGERGVIVGKQLGFIFGGKGGGRVSCPKERNSQLPIGK